MSHRSTSQAIRDVLDAVGGRSGTVWIGVDGKGAAGKTTLAERIAAVLPGAVVIHVDDFARPDRPGWELDRFVAQVRDPLLAGRRARYQRWDWTTDEGADWVEIDPGLPVIVEGVSATDVRLGIPWDLTIWVDAPREMRLSRALERDGIAMRDRWLTDWMPGEDEYERVQQPQDRIGLIVDGTC